jgi:hypothetical protein
MDLRCFCCTTLMDVILVRQCFIGVMSTSCILHMQWYAGSSQRSRPNSAQQRPRTRRSHFQTGLSSGARPSEALEAEPVRRDQGRSIKARSTALDLLLPLAGEDRDQTLAGSGEGSGSPRGLPRPWGGDGATRRIGASSVRGGTAGWDPRMRICVTAGAELDHGLQATRLRRPWTKREGGVRLLGVLGVHSCRNREHRGFRSPAISSSSLQTEI